MKRRTPPQGLIARVADGCFWFGRYVERNEATARQLIATLDLALDGDLSPRQSWYPMVVVSGEEPALRARLGDAAVEDGEAVQRYLVWDEECPVSLVRSVRAARENARSVREVLSAEVWEAINELHLWLQQPVAQAEWRAHPDAFYRRVRQTSHLILGLFRSTMLRDTPLLFMWLGLLLERVGQTARLLDVHHHAFADTGPAHVVVETGLWKVLLRALSGEDPFMKAHAGQVTSAAVARFLIGEARFPRSIAYCAHSAYERLCAIRPVEDDHLPGKESLERLGALDRWVQELPAALGDLHALLTHVVDETAAICDTIGRELLGYGGGAPGGASVEG